MSDPTTIADVLDAAADLIEPEGAWTQGSYERVVSGRRCFCAEGAIYASASGRSLVLYKASIFLGGMLPAYSGNPIANWNDAPERTQAEVVAKLREAAALARARGQ